MEETTPKVTTSKASPNMIIAAVVVVVLLLGLGGYFFLGKNTTKPSDTTASVTKAPEPTSSNAFTSIQDALSKSLSLTCTFTDDKTNVQTTAYIKNGTIRADITGQKASENSSFIMKDNKMYIWSGKEGMMMTFDMNEMKKQSEAPAMPGGNPANMMEALEKFKESCKPATVSDSVFTLPSDVTFSDLSKMMPSGMMMPKTSNMPAMPSGVSKQQMEDVEKNVKEMMEKMQSSQQ